MLLHFYTFKTLYFYCKLSLCKPNFFHYLFPFFTTCTKTVRQIKRMIYPLFVVWHCLASKGSVWLGVVLQYS